MYKYSHKKATLHLLNEKKIMNNWKKKPNIFDKNDSN